MTSFLPWAKKTSEQSKLCSDVVRLKGFEPPTFWFVAKHSIQLSYSRISFCWRFRNFKFPEKFLLQRARRGKSRVSSISSIKNVCKRR